MSSRIGVLTFIILLFFQISYVSALTNGIDATALQSIRNEWSKYPESWKGSDPCGSNWVGITCNKDRVVSISVGNLNLEGKLSGDISELSELQILDLSYNPGLSGPLPPNIGDLKKLRNLILVGCAFSGQIPQSIGSLKQLIYLSLNLNQFKGTIPASIGLLSNLYWFDIADNQIGGNIPISNGTSPGLDMLLETKHFHFGKNKLSGEIPEKLFSSNMTLIHMLFDGNQFTGKIPDSLSLVKSLAVLRLDRNKLSGDIPSSLNNLTNLNEMYLANNRLTGSLPNLASLNSLYTLDVSNNTLEFSVIPSWLSSLRSLSTLRMEGIQLEGPIPIFLFSPTELQTINLKRNGINETLDFGTNYSEQLEFVDLQSNDITHYRPTSSKHIQVLLANNPVCMELGNVPSYCSIVQHNSSFSTLPTNCAPCVLNRTPSPTCQCVYPITGTLFFRSPSFSGFFNSTNFLNLQQGMVEFFKKFGYPVDSVAIRNIREDTTDRQLLIDLLVFPLGKVSFNQTEMAILGFAFSNQTYKPPKIFGPYIFQANPYGYFSDIGGGSEVGRSKSLSTGGIIGIVFGAVVLLLVIGFGIWISLCCKKREQKNKGKGNDRINHQQVRVTETETETSVRVKSRITELEV